MLLTSRSDRPGSSPRTPLHPLETAMHPVRVHDRRLPRRGLRTGPAAGRLSAAHPRPGRRRPGALLRHIFDEHRQAPLTPAPAAPATGRPPRTSPSRSCCTPGDMPTGTRGSRRPDRPTPAGAAPTEAPTARRGHSDHRAYGQSGSSHLPGTCNRSITTCTRADQPFRPKVADDQRSDMRRRAEARWQRASWRLRCAAGRLRLPARCEEPPISTRCPTRSAALLFVLVA